MKLHYYLLLVVALLMTSISCTRELEQDEPTTSGVAPVFTAVLENTKTSIDATRKVSWDHGDIISVNGALYSTEGPDESGVTTFRIMEGQTLPPSEEGTVYRAVYPSDLASGETLKLPVVQTYTEGHFNMPLYAESEGTSLSFKHICGMLKITIGTTSGFATIGDISVSSANCATSGEFTVVDNKAVLAEPGHTAATVRLACGNVTMDSDKTFYIAIPAQSYSKLKIRVEGKDSEGVTMTKYMVTKDGVSINVDRNTIYPIAFAETQAAESVNLLDGRVLSMNNYKLGSSVKGSPQGAAFYDGKIYQFRVDNTGKKVGVDVGEAESTANWEAYMSEVVTPDCHAGSATFGKKIFTKADGYEYDCTMPFVYVTGHYSVDGIKYETIDVLDLEHANTVHTLTFPDLPDDAIAAYDFDNDKVWMIGYPTATGIAPYYIREFDVELDELNMAQTNFTQWNWQVTTSGPDEDGIQRTLHCGTVQDVYYYNGYLYFLTGRGTNYNRTEWVKVHSFNLATREEETTIAIPSYNEGQGFMYDEANDIFYATVYGSNELWKLTTSGGDPKYNYEPATDTGTDTYSIANASQLVWFLGQVYSGRCTISGTLVADIDMTGINNPYTMYIYDTSSPRKFDAQYGFRGTFDGGGHTISSITITSTPYSDIGLFPYVLGGTIKDVTVAGGITMSKPQSYDYPTDNMGFIGYMEGGTVSGVNVVDFAVNVSTYTLSKTVNGETVTKDYTPTNYDPLIGYAVDVTLIDNIKPTAHAEDGSGHVYVNGVCIATGDCNAQFEPATQSAEGTYQITNAGNLYWFANSLNAGDIARDSDAELTNDIDMKSGQYGSFPGLGYTTTLYYGGVFDGQGHSILNYYQEHTAATNTARTGFINSMKGASATDKAIVRNLTISGTKTLGIGQSMHGTVVGDASDFTLIENVVSSVSLSSTGNSIIFGGIAGSLSKTTAVMNRCRYSGTISNIKGTTKVGGLVGDLRGGTIQNSLFDGTISGTGTSLNYGGLVGASSTTANGSIQTSLAAGTMNISSANSTQSAYVLGTATVKTSLSNVYYYGTELPGIGTGVQANTDILTGTATNADAMTAAELLTALGSAWTIIDGKLIPLTD